MGRPSGFMTIGWLLLAATGYFFLVPLIFPLPVSACIPRVLAILSLLPMAVGLLGMLKRPLDRKAATGIAQLASSSCWRPSPSLVDGYLIDLAAHP